MQKFREKIRKFHNKKLVTCKKRKFCEKQMQNFSEKEEKLFLCHNKTSNIELSEQRLPQVLLCN